MFKDLATRVEDSEGKYVVLDMDEMKVKEDLVYNKHTSQIVGFFVNLGSTEQQLLALEQEERSAASPLATHVLHFMVRGICMRLDYPGLFHILLHPACLRNSYIQSYGM